MTSDIPDFLDLPTTAFDQSALRRTDLADLRLHVRHPEGIEDGRCISKASRKRLIAHGMLDRQQTADGARTFATQFGVEVVKANASCRDGSESITRPPAYYRDVHTDVLAVHVLAHERTLKVQRDAAFLANAMADTLPPPATTNPELSDPPARRGRLRTVLVAVGRWIGRLVDDIADDRKV